MVWKCPKCPKRFTKYTTYTKHYASAHHTRKAGSVSKGKDKKVYKAKIPVWARKGKKKR